jgi:hypothetical protein
MYVFLVVFFLRVFLKNFLCSFLRFPANSIIFDLIILIIDVCVRDVCTMEILITQYASCYCIPLRSKYFPQNPVLEHLQSVLFP